MRAMFAIVFVIGLALAGFAATLINGQLAQKDAALEAQRTAASQRAETVTVYAVRHKMTYGQRITTDDLAEIPYVARYLPEGTFTSLDDIFPEGFEVPRMVLRPMEKLEPLLAAKVTEPGSTAGLVTRLDRGMRAFTIQTDVSAGVSGFLRPGDKVDVYWTGTPPGGQRGNVTRLIDSALEIMAIDQTDDASYSGAQIARTVTVKVTAQQVAALAQAQATGRLSLALVGSSDDGIINEEIEVDQNSLLGIETVAAPTPEPRAAPARICTVRTRKGAEIQEIEVPCTD